MSKCEEFGYLVGDLFWVMEAGVLRDSVVRLIEDDGTDQPRFEIVNGKYSGRKIYLQLQGVALVKEEEKPEILCGYFDPVTKPSHYASGQIECIEAMKAQMSREEFEGYLKGNVVKYLWRWRGKGGVESLKKGQWYLDRLIEEVE